MKDGLLTMKKLLQGQSLTRIRMNRAFAAHRITGRVVDVGGGRNPDYFQYFKKDDGVQVEALDGSLTGINFEEHALPYSDGSIDTIILANVLEHIYNHQFLLREVKRVIAPNGKLVGFVPFWMNYHPDPHDYFRYTREALVRMFEEVGFTSVSVEALPGGPFLANFNTLVLSLPRVIRPLLYGVYAVLDAVFLTLRPAARHRTPLGFVFSAHD